jgi:hypothetical protein
MAHSLAGAHLLGGAAMSLPVAVILSLVAVVIVWLTHNELRWLKIMDAMDEETRRKYDY